MDHQDNARPSNEYNLAQCDLTPFNAYDAAYDAAYHPFMDDPSAPFDFEPQDPSLSGLDFGLESQYPSFAGPTFDPDPTALPVIGNNDPNLGLMSKNPGRDFGPPEIESSFSEFPSVGGEITTFAAVPGHTKAVPHHSYGLAGRAANNMTRCIPFTRKQKDAAPPHDWEGYPHNAAAWVQGTQLFVCASINWVWRGCGLFFLNQTDHQDHQDHHNQIHSTPFERSVFIGCQWLHEGLIQRSGPSEGEIRNKGQLVLHCPEQECTWTSVGNTNRWLGLDEHLRGHKLHDYHVHDNVLYLEKVLRCNRWMCSYEDCQKIFHRQPDYKRHRPVHDRTLRDFPCPADDCERGGDNGFPRKDKLRDHMRAKHPSLAEELMQTKKRRRVASKGKGRRA